MAVFVEAKIKLIELVELLESVGLIFVEIDELRWVWEGEL